MPFLRHRPSLRAAFPRSQVTARLTAEPREKPVFSSLVTDGVVNTRPVLPGSRRRRSDLYGGVVAKG
jgi:hypothetical protein